MIENLINHISSSISSIVHYVSTEYAELFRLSKVHSTEVGISFGFAEFITVLAVFLVVLTASDFQTKYRFSLMSFDVKRWTIYISAIWGTILLFYDVADAFEIRIPAYISNADIVRATIAFLVLSCTIYLLFSAVIRVPKFSREKSKKFLSIHHQVIMRGDEEELKVIADNIGYFIFDIIKLSNRTSVLNGQNNKDFQFANSFLFLLANDRFIAVAARTRPDLICEIFENVERSDAALSHLRGFCNGVAWALIEDETSALHQECSFMHSGLLGHFGHVGKIVFGQVPLVDELSRGAYSPLELPYASLRNLNEKQYKALMYGAKIYTKSLISNSCVHYSKICSVHSNVLKRLLRLNERTWFSALNDDENGYERDEFHRLEENVDFLKFVVDELGRNELQAAHLRLSESRIGEDLFDLLARTIVDLVPKVAAVSEPYMLSWEVQHNTFWAKLFERHDEQSLPVIKQIAFKVRRLMYLHILQMEDIPNFLNAKTIAFALNVFGLSLRPRNTSVREEFYAIQKLALQWAKKNFLKLYDERQALAEACLTGRITFDPERKCLVQTFSSFSGAPPHIEILELDQPDDSLRSYNT